MEETILRGTKFKEYSIKKPIDPLYYEGDIWNPSPHETLKGEFIDILEDIGRFNQCMYIIDSDRIDKLYDKVFGCASLDRQMKQVAKGSVIELEYIGKNEIKNYHEYKVSILKKEE